MRAVRIDAEGYFLEDIPGDPEYQGDDGTAPAMPEGHRLMRPRWTGEGWVEGESPAVLEALELEAIASTHRAWRNAELARADLRVNDALDRQQLDRYHAWAEYRVALRDMPQQSPDPRNWTRPEAPQA